MLQNDTEDTPRWAQDQGFCLVPASLLTPGGTAGLSRCELRIVLAVARGSLGWRRSCVPISVSELNLALGAGRSTVSGAVTRLVRDGFLQFYPTPQCHAAPGGEPSSRRTRKLRLALGAVYCRPSSGGSDRLGLGETRDDLTGEFVQKTRQFVQPIRQIVSPIRQTRPHKEKEGKKEGGGPTAAVGDPIPAEAAGNPNVQIPISNQIPNSKSQCPDVLAFVEKLNRGLSAGRFVREPDPVYVAEVDRWVERNRVTAVELNRLYRRAVAELRFMPTIAELNEMLPHVRVASPPAPTATEPEPDEAEMRMVFENLEKAIG